MKTSLAIVMLIAAWVLIYAGFSDTKITQEIKYALGYADTPKVPKAGSTVAQAGAAGLNTTSRDAEGRQ